MNPFVFIVGCPRSGTTLLQRMVDAHREIATTPETHWIPKVFDGRTGLTEGGFVTAELLKHLSRERRFIQLEPDMGELERLVGGGDRVSYGDFVTAVFDQYGRRHGKPLVGDKTPGYVRALRKLSELWPEARFVHLIRDGRDVCLSATSWTRRRESLARRYPTWPEEPVFTAALWWERHVRKGRKGGRPLAPERYLEVRYEALVADPEAACAELCDFLGVRYDDAMVRFHEGRTKIKPGLDAKHAWLPVTTGLRDWRTELPAEDVEGFEAVAGDLLEDAPSRPGAGTG